MIMLLDHLFKGIKGKHTEKALIWHNKFYSIQWMQERTAYWQKWIAAQDFKDRKVVAFRYILCPEAITLAFALLENKFILVPVDDTLGLENLDVNKVTEAEIELSFTAKGEITCRCLNSPGLSSSYKTIKEKKHAGLVILRMSRGGKLKAGVYDFNLLYDELSGFEQPYITLVTGELDFISILSAVFSAVEFGGCTVLSSNQRLVDILKLIRMHKVQALITTSHFSSRLAASKIARKHDLQSLELITYGPKPLGSHNLHLLKSLLPQSKLHMVKNAGCFGYTNSIVRKNGSAWMRINEADTNLRIVNNILWVRGRSSFLGYLNRSKSAAVQPWIETGDVVDIRDGYYRILGKRSETIACGDKNIYCSEVEDVILELDNIKDAIVFGAENPILGRILATKVKTREPQSIESVKASIRKQCSQKLSPHQIPAKIELADV